MNLNYLYHEILSAEFPQDGYLRQAFRQHLDKVAEALLAIENNDPDEDRLITACLEPEPKEYDDYQPSEYAEWRDYDPDC